MAILTSLVRNIYSPSVVPEELGETLSRKPAIIYTRAELRAQVPISAFFLTISLNTPSLLPVCRKPMGTGLFSLGFQENPAQVWGWSHRIISWNKAAKET